jgi:hypothetical protein
VTVISVSKVEAARRQLDTAIELWFGEDDPVSVHTLAFAAYEVFHFVSEHRNPNRRDLIFDTFMIKDEFRRDWNRVIRSHANFFKHADRDPEEVVEFDPDLSEWFILYASVGRDLCGEVQTENESIFLWWFQISRPELLTEKGREFVSDRVPADVLAALKALPKNQFLKGARLAGLGKKRPIVELS